MSAPKHLKTKRRQAKNGRGLMRNRTRAKLQRIRRASSPRLYLRAFRFARMSSSTTPSLTITQPVPFLCSLSDHSKRARKRPLANVGQKACEATERKGTKHADAQLSALDPIRLGRQRPRVVGISNQP